MSDDRLQTPQLLAAEIRKTALKMVHRARASHIGGALSVADILAGLYCEWLKISPETVNDEHRDRLIFSKGHAAAAFYATLALKGFFSMEWLDDYCADGAHLGGHVSRHGIPGVELSTGSLGHGLSVGLGMAVRLKRKGSSARVVVVMSDGECDEGSVWEAAMASAHFGVSNLAVIVDYNNIQALGNVDEVMPLEPFAEKWESFGWYVREIDGHSHDEISGALHDLPFGDDGPSAIIAHTVKGKGVSFMENSLAWHYKSPDEAQLEQALTEIDSMAEKFR